MAKTPSILSSSMVAEKLGFSQDYIRRLCLDGKIKAQKIGHDWVIYERDIKHLKRQRSPKLKKGEKLHGNSKRSD